MDPIQKKLLLIEDQLNRPDFHKQLFRSCPLLFAAFGLITGIILQNFFNFPLPPLLLLLIASALAAIIFFARSKSTLHTWPLAYTALICFTCLGAVRLLSYHRPNPNDIRNLVTGDRTLAAIQGRIVTEPYINRNENWKFQRFIFTDAGTSFYLDITAALTTSGWADATGTVRVRVNEPVFDLNSGDRIRLYCWLEKFSSPTNPGQFNVAKFLARKNVFLAASVNSRDAIEIIIDKTAPLPRITSKLRNIVKALLLADITAESPSAGLLEALLLGSRSNIDSATYAAFRETGLLHFISLSGMHLGIFIGILWRLCRIAGLIKPARSAVCLIALAVFLLIVPPRAPTLRAAIICVSFCASFFFHRRSNPLNSLSLAAIILLLITPTSLFDAGWQLSFTCVLGILFFPRWIENFFREKILDRPPPQNLRIQLRLYGLIVSVTYYPLKMFAVGIAAWLGGAGILLYHFHTICPLTSLWTVAAFPFIAFILILGYVKIILASLLPTAAMALAALLAGLCDLLIRLVTVIANLNISEILIGSVPIAVIAIYYIYLFFIRFIYLKKPLLKKTISITGALALIFFFGLTKYHRTFRDDLTINCLDVGHGQAILAQLPGTDNILFDAGSISRSDIGRRIVGPFLKYSGISKIDSVVISHADIDHINAVPEVVEIASVESVYANSVFLEKINSTATTAFLSRLLEEKNLKIQLLDTAIETAHPAEIKILWPDEQATKNKTLSDNDNSTVVLITFAGRKVLLCADIENYAQARLTKSHPNLTADIVIAPHHGSAKTMYPGFLEQLNPAILICSCGKNWYENNRLIAPIAGAEMFYTHVDGAVTIRIDKAGHITTSTFTPRK